MYEKPRPGTDESKNLLQRGECAVEECGRTWSPKWYTNVIVGPDTGYICNKCYRDWYTGGGRDRAGPEGGAGTPGRRGKATSTVPFRDFVVCSKSVKDLLHDDTDGSVADTLPFFNPGTQGTKAGWGGGARVRVRDSRRKRCACRL